MISVLIFGFLWWSSEHPDNRETGYSNVLSLPPTWAAAMLVSVVCRPSSSAFLTCTISKTCASFWSVAFDCGEDKERIESPEPFPELVHLLLGWHKYKECKASNLQRRGETYCTACCILPIAQWWSEIWENLIPNQRRSICESEELNKCRWVVNHYQWCLR